MSLNTLLKNKQRRMLSKTWREKLIEHEIEKNNFHATGSVKIAHEFAKTAMNYHPEEIIDVDVNTEPIVVYSLT